MHARPRRRPASLARRGGQTQGSSVPALDHVESAKHISPLLRMLRGMTMTAAGVRGARVVRWGTILTASLVLALIVYKANGAMTRLRTGALPHPLAGGPLHATWLYLKTIWPALTFGVL